MKSIRKLSFQFLISYIKFGLNDVEQMMYVLDQQSGCYLDA